MTTAGDELPELDITSMPRYIQHGYPWEAWDRMRQLAPVYWYEGRPRFEPFWAVTGYEQIRFVGSHPDLFSNTGVIRLDTVNGLNRLDAYRRRRAERHGGTLRRRWTCCTPTGPSISICACFRCGGSPRGP